jgi:hypothetical protein
MSTHECPTHPTHSRCPSLRCLYLLWSCCFFPACNRYYYNPDTKESRWTNPADGAADEDDPDTPMEHTQGDVLRRERLKNSPKTGDSSSPSPRNAPLARVDPTYI